MQNYNLTDKYIGSLLSKPRKPLILWRGTGGLVWSRILSFCVKEQGGYVVGHDHSHGQGAWKSNSHQIIEYPFCDKFIVWTHSQRKFAIENISSNLNFGYNSPEVCVVPRLEKTFSKKRIITRSKRENVKKTRVMYVSTVYSIDKVTFLPILRTNSY